MVATCVILVSRAARGLIRMFLAPNVSWTCYPVLISSRFSLTGPRFPSAPRCIIVDSQSLGIRTGSWSAGCSAFTRDNWPPLKFGSSQPSKNTARQQHAKDFYRTGIICMGIIAMRLTFPRNIVMRLDFVDLAQIWGRHTKTLPLHKTYKIPNSRFATLRVRK